MNKKLLCVLLLICMVAVSLPACGKSDAGEPVAEETTKSITIINSKSEVQTYIENLAMEYEKETGVHVEVITTPAGVDAQATTKGLYLSDQMADIFACEAADFASWEGLVVDMSDMEWTSRTDAEYVDSEYGTLGFPYTTEAIGMAYNGDILSKAGIDPASLTSPQAYAQAFEKLDLMKEELGITAVVGYSAEPKDLGWSAGNHIFGAYLDSGLSRDDTTYIDLFNDNGKIDDARGKDYAAFIGMLNTYSDPQLLTAGTYTDQVANFASGKYAFVTQGSWIGASLSGEFNDKYSAAGSFPVGMAPYAFQDGIDTILTSPPAWWAIAKEGNVEEAKAFLQWCSESAGQKILVEGAGFISPFSDCQFIAADPFAGVISNYISAGKTSNWHWMNMKAGIGQATICFCFYNYAAGLTDADGFINEIRTTSEEYYMN